MRPIRLLILLLAVSLALVLALMRPVLRRELPPEEAVRAYHGALQRRGLAPARALADDLQITEPALQG